MVLLDSLIALKESTLQRVEDFKEEDARQEEMDIY